MGLEVEVADVVVVLAIDVEPLVVTVSNLGLPAAAFEVDVLTGLEVDDTVDDWTRVCNTGRPAAGFEVVLAMLLEIDVEVDLTGDRTGRPAAST